MDPARTPGVVEALRNARAAARDHAAQVAQMRQQLAELDQYGGVEGLTQMAALNVGALMSDPAQGALPFLQSLWQNSQPAYAEVLSQLVQAEPAFLVAALQQAGHLPEQPQARAGSIDQEILGTVPDALKEQYRNTPQEMRDELDLMSEAARNHFLEREAQLQRLDATQREQAQRTWDGQLSQAKQEGAQAFQGLSDQYEQAHFAQFNKWQPFGPENQPKNERLYRTIMEGAFAELLNDSNFNSLYWDSHALINNAPTRKLLNEGYAAGQDERTARGKAAQFNTRLGQVMREMVQDLDTTFRDARAWRESQRQSAPQRTEIPGTGSTTNGNTGGIPAIDPKTGKTSQAWIDQVLVPSLGRR